MIKIVGLGPGSPDALTIGAVKALEESENLYFRTEKHPTVDYLKEVSKRLNRVLIENQDFERLIKTYDRLDALFYLDPPYYEAEKYYPDRFNPEDHNRLRKCLEDIKGKFILSYNDCPQIRELYEGYVILTVERNHNLSLGNQYKEILIKNYK